MAAALAVGHPVDSSPEQTQAPTHKRLVPGAAWVFDAW